VISLLPKNFLKKLIQQSGFTMAELMISLVIFAVCMAGISQLMITMKREDMAFRAAYDFEEDLMRAQYLLKKSFRTATGLRDRGGVALDTFNLVSTPIGADTKVDGRLYEDFDSTTFAPDSTTRTVAVFMRENASLTSGVPNATSSLLPTGIYFQQPAPTTYGVIYVDQGTQATLAPRIGEFAVGHVVSLVIGDVKYSNVAGSNVIKSFSATVTLRVPTSDSTVAPTWCDTPHLATAGCATTSTTKDVARKMTITLNDNMDFSKDINGKYLDELLSGRVYFLR
jgi:prepilin-type N-terminal cleavage/methylation domain-containing protein